MHHFQKTRKRYKRANAGDQLLSECTFCTKETRQETVDESETIFIVPNRVSYDIFEGLRISEHLMVIPKRHVESLEELTLKEKRDFIELLTRYEGKATVFTLVALIISTVR